MVFQDYLLFPHLTALDNVAFGPRCHGVDQGARPARRPPSGWTGSASPTTPAPSPASCPAARPSASPWPARWPPDPRLLLLDEPLAALDARTRLDIRAQLRRHLADFDGVAVLVTHDPLDAMVLADRLVVIEDGRVVQEGTPADIARHPRTDYIARLVGLNLYRGRPTATRSGSTPARPSPPPRTSTGPAFVAFPPTAVTLYRDRPTGPAPATSGAARSPASRRHGDQIRVDLTGESPLAADLTTGRRRRTRPAPGRTGLGRGQGDPDPRLPRLTRRSGSP